MSKRKKRVLQFKITLLESKPQIWRRIQIPEQYSFWDLHVAIQEAMGWTDSHLHAFEVMDFTTGEPQQIGIPDEGGWNNILPGWDFRISDYFCKQGDATIYEYDFGDDCAIK